MGWWQVIHVVCDKCKKDCGLVAYDLIVGIIHNPCPTNMFDTGDLKATCDRTKIRMVVCQDCYRSIGLPNIYKAVRERKLTWRDAKKDGDSQ